MGGAATFILTATIAPSATGTLVNTASVAPPTGVTDPTPGNNVTSASATLTPKADLTIMKTNGGTTVVPGTSITYAIVVSNNGPSGVTGALVTDPLPPALTGAMWTCVASPGSLCGVTSGTGSIAMTVNLLVGGAATFTLTATIAPSATGVLVNTAAVAAPGGVTDPTPGNNTATDTTTLAPQADLSITKTDGVTMVVPGATTTYTIVVRNSGPSVVTEAAVTDTLPAALTDATWTCVASAGSACGEATGTGSVATTVDLLVGGTARFTLVARIGASATGQLVNTASVTAPTDMPDPTPANNAVSDTDTLILPSQPIPTLSPSGMLLLLGWLVGVAWWVLRPRGLRS